MTTFPSKFTRLMAFAVFSVMPAVVFSSSKSSPRTVEYKFPGGVDRVTFDPSRVMENELDRWMELSPVLGPFNFMTVPEDLELCKSEDPRYHCPAELNLTHAGLNLKSIADRVKKLSPENYPSGLPEVVMYLRKVQSAHLWMEQQKLSFLETNDPVVLEKRYGDIDPKIQCENVIRRIRSTSDMGLRSHFARFEWYNCILAPVQKELGPYPIEQWKSFLAAHGIQEKKIEESPD